MKSRLFIFLICLGLLGAAKAQNNDPVLMTVAGEKVTTSDFLSVYKKNNSKSEIYDRKSLEEYLDLFINFKLKVQEANEMKLDTFSTFKTELAGYRKQLAQPYLTDKEVDENLLKEAYDREQFDVRASHILIRVDKNALPADTLIAYKKIMALRDRIVKGESFADVAREASEDPSARDRTDPGSKNVVKGNAGDLGFFSVLDMIYPFENAAYNTPVGKVSMPVRTEYGYHLIYVTKKQPAMGKITAAHIFVSVPKDAKPEDLSMYKAKIDEAYAKLKSGSKFEDVVTAYTDDKGSASKGGVLPPFGVNRMVPEFIEVISTLKNTGDYSEPIQTMYGWHIVKLVDRKPIKSFEEEKSQLKTRIIKDARSEKSKSSVVARIKAENNFVEIPASITEFDKVLDTTFFEGKWDKTKAQALNKKMFVLSNKTYTQSDFTDFLDRSQRKYPKMNIAQLVNETYSDFVEESVINFEDGLLETKYPEFKSLMKEYRDGIMLFELTDKKVWSKAIEDTAGMKTFYEEKEPGKYMWSDRVEASVYTCNNLITANSLKKLLPKVLSGKMTESALLAKFNNDSITNVIVEHKKFSKGDNPIIDSIPWKKGITKPFSKGKKVDVVAMFKTIAPEPKSIKEAKGLITADYQNYLEKEWIAELKKKYPVEVNKAVFESLIKN